MPRGKQHHGSTLSVILKIQLPTSDVSSTVHVLHVGWVIVGTLSRARQSKACDSPLMQNVLDEWCFTAVCCVENLKITEAPGSLYHISCHLFWKEKCVWCFSMFQLWARGKPQSPETSLDQKRSQCFSLRKKPFPFIVLFKIQCYSQ